jgi:hypothetical protein
MVLGVKETDSAQVEHPSRESTATKPFDTSHWTHEHAINAESAQIP